MAEKPRLSLKAARLLCRVIAYCREWLDGPGIFSESMLRSCASDVMDGYSEPDDPEVKELIRRGLIEPIKNKGRAGDRWTTWGLTDLGCDVVCPAWRKLRTQERSDRCLRVPPT